MTRIKRLFQSEHTKPFLVVFLAILLINLTPLIMGKSRNPILQRSGLATSITPGPVGGQSTIDPNDGFTSQALGRRAAQSWLQGDVPYWNHYEGIGSPLAGGMQSAAFFPLVLLLYFGNGFIIMHFFLQLIAGFTTYLLLRKIKLSSSIAIIGGILFALNGAFAWLTNAAFNPIAFLPMLLLGIEVALIRAEKKRRGGWLVIALALSLSLYSGFPETAYINALFAYGWGVVRMIQIKRSAWKPFIYKLLFASILGLLLSAPILVPFLGYLPHATTGGHSDSGYAHVSLNIKTLPALFMPYIYGPIFGFSDTGKALAIFLFWSNVGGYISMPLITSALLGLFSRRRLAHKLYLSTFSLVIILKIYGFKPVEYMVNVLPGMKLIAFYRYSIPALSLALIILAMFGLEAIKKAEITKKRIIGATGFAVFFLASLALYARNLVRQLGDYSSHHSWAVLSVVWGMTIVGIAVACFLKKEWRSKSIGFILLIDSAVLFMIPFLSLPNIPEVNTKPVSFLQKNIGVSRFYTLHPIAPNYGSYYEIASINVNNLPVPKNWAEYIPDKLDRNANALVFTGYSRVDPLGPSALEEFGRNIKEFENLSVKYLVTDRGQVSEKFSNSFGLKLVHRDETVEIFELPNSKGYFESIANCKLTYTSRDVVEADCPKETTIIRRELSFPGWRVKVNDISRPIQTEKDIFQAVAVPAGKSKTYFSYSPPYVNISYGLFAAGLLLTIGGYLNLGEAQALGKKYIYRFLRTLRLK